MLSVLIPVYNYDVTELVGSIHKQLTNFGKDFEILVMDDRSDEEFVNINKGITELTHTDYIISNEKNGRLRTRILLSELARYDWLLFLDADTLPKTDDFIQNYLNAIDDSTEVIFGGFAYYNDRPEPSRLLRWKYGRKHEVSPDSIRNQRPYKLIISANFLIRKSILMQLNLKITGVLYGYDSYFGSRLKSENINVRHIDNEVYHLGIEESSKYLKKKEQAAEALLHFYENKMIDEHQNSLLSFFVSSRKLGLHHLFAWIFEAFSHNMRSNLTGRKPSIKLLQLYRISYLCRYYKSERSM